MWQFSPIYLLYMASILISYRLAIYAWRVRSVRGALAIFLLTLSTGNWSLGYLLGFASTTLIWKLIFMRLEYLGILGVVFSFSLFVLTYTQSGKWVSRRTVALLAIMPLTFYALILTLQSHALFYQQPIGMKMVEGFWVLDKIYGPAFWVTASYDYLILFIGSVILIQSIIRFPNLYRGQIVTFILGALTPLVSNILYVLGFNPISPHDPSTLSFTLAGVLLVIGIRRYSFLNIAPTSYDLVFKSITSGVIVLDQKGRIIDINPMAQVLLRLNPRKSIGRLIQEALPKHHALIAGYQTMLEIKTEIELSKITICSLHITPLYSKNKIAGRLIILHDITLQKQNEAMLKIYHNRLDALVTERTAELEIANLKLKRVTQQLINAQETERGHIARELHDQIGQMLTGIKLSLERVARLPKEKQGEVLDDTKKLTQQLIAEVRNMSLDLRPAMLDDYGLLSTLRWHFKRYNELTDIVVDFHCTLNDRLSAEVETTIYRVIQESLTNVARHANTKKVMVKLYFEESKLIITVEDQGRGFTLDEDQEIVQSAGLLGMQERTNLIGGNFTIQSTLGKGTLVRIIIPLKSEGKDG